VLYFKFIRQADALSLKIANGRIEIFGYKIEMCKTHGSHGKKKFSNFVYQKKRPAKNAFDKNLTQNFFRERFLIQKKNLFYHRLNNELAQVFILSLSIALNH
jgi:hypothetical protein